MGIQDYIISFFSGYEKDTYSLLIYIVSIIIYSFIVWNFYINLSKRDLIKFNLYKFDVDPAFKKFFDMISYLIKYIIVTPFLSAIWFIIMLTLLIFMAKSQEIYSLSIIVVTLIAATRATAYYDEGLAMELAKIIPFTLLTFFIIDPKIFNISVVLERFNEIPELIPLLLRFLAIVLLLEIVLRFLFEIKELFFGE